MLLLIANRKSYTRFRLVPKSTTLDDPELTLNGYYALCCITHFTLLVSLDLSVAFDMIDHAVLLERLTCSFSVTGTVHSWIQSYLCGRSQSVFYLSLCLPEWWINVCMYVCNNASNIHQSPLFKILSKELELRWDFLGLHFVNIYFLNSLPSCWTMNLQLCDPYVSHRT